MTPARGQTLRRIGLVIEVLCMLGLLSLARGKEEIWRGFPMEPSRFLSIGLAAGFALWVAGTLAIFAGRKRPAEPEK